MKRLRSLSFVLFVLSFFSVQVFAQESDITAQFLGNSQKSSTAQNQNLKNCSSNLNSNKSCLIELENSQEMSQQESTNPLNLLNKQESLLDELDNQFLLLEQQLQQAKNSLSHSELLIKSLESQLQRCKVKIEDLQKNLEEYNQALHSNKDDTHSILFELGEAITKAEMLETEIAALKAQRKRSWWFTTIGITATSLVPVTIGAIEYLNGNCVRGKDYMLTGAGLFIGGQIVYQGGHWIFKWW